MFKIGDKVKVIDNGQLYTTYDKFFTALCPKLLWRYRKREVGNGTTGEVIFKDYHLTFTDSMLYVVKISAMNVILIGESGLVMQ